MNRWKGKVAVVTGASAGIGAEIARSLTEHGVTVIGLSKKYVKLQVYVKEVHEKIIPIKCDMTNEEEVVAAFKYIEDHFGGVDIMINNASVSMFSGLKDGKTEVWKEVFDINVMSLNICNREALKTMRKRGDDGHIININSFAGHCIPLIPDLGIYTASKHAVKALTGSLRNDLRMSNSRIRVSSISPGLMNSDTFTKDVNMSDMSRKTDIGNVPNQKYLAAEDISQAVLTVLSMPQNLEIQEMIISSPGKPIMQVPIAK